MTRIYLIRHATVENPRNLLYGHLDNFRLSAKGREEAAALGRRLSQTGLSRIVHSPLERAQETADLIAAQLPAPPKLIADPELSEAEFSRYLQGVPYWQIPIRRPLWFVHKARRGLLPGDESYRVMGGRVLQVMHRVAAEHPAEVSALISHADPLQAAWILLEGRPQNEREMQRKLVDRAGVLEVDLVAGSVRAVNYVPPPSVTAVAPAA